MIGADVISLSVKTYGVGDLGQPMETGETLREVYCDAESISRSEWVKAGEMGLHPAWKVSMISGDYGGETEAVFRGERYGVYRTYFDKFDRVELYLERKTGVRHE